MTGCGVPDLSLKEIYALLIHDIRKYSPEDNGNSWIVLLGLFPLHMSKISSFQRLAFKFKRLQGAAANPPPQLHAALQQRLPLNLTEEQLSAETALTTPSGVALQSPTSTRIPTAAKQGMIFLIKAFMSVLAHNHRFTCRSRRAVQVKNNSSLIH